MITHLKDDFIIRIAVGPRNWISVGRRDRQGQSEPRRAQPASFPGLPADSEPGLAPVPAGRSQNVALGQVDLHSVMGDTYAPARFALSGNVENHRLTPFGPCFCLFSLRPMARGFLVEPVHFYHADAGAIIRPADEGGVGRAVGR